MSWILILRNCISTARKILWKEKSLFQKICPSDRDLQVFSCSPYCDRSYTICGIWKGVGFIGQTKKCRENLEN